MPKPVLARLEMRERRFDYRLAVLAHVHEDERQNPDREHRQPDAHAIVDPLDPPQRKADIDREAGDRAQRDCLGETHRHLSFAWSYLGIPNFYHTGRNSWPRTFVRRRFRDNRLMHVTAKADYAVRAVVELVGSKQASPRKVDEIAQAQGIPVSFLENILTQLRSAGIVHSQRGPEGGYWLARPAEQGNLAPVLRAGAG